MNFITPEHITIALLSVGDVGARQVVQKCACSELPVLLDTVKPLSCMQTSANAGTQDYARHCCEARAALIFVSVPFHQHTVIGFAGWEWMRRPSRRRPSSASSASRRAKARPSAGRKW